MIETVTRPATYRGNGQNSGLVDRLPPHSIESEEATIGSCLIDPTAIERVAAIFRDEPSPFYIVKNQWVWDAIVTLAQRGDPVDFVTITRELTARNQIDELGGPAYISHLINVVPTAMHAEGYAKIVSDGAIRRRMLDAAGYLARAAYDESELQQAVTLDRAQHSLDTLKRSREIGAAQIEADFFWCHEALTPAEPVEWLIDGTLPVGGVSSLFGLAKRGKTYLALSIGLHVAAGLSWAGLNVKPGAVLWVDEESGRRRIHGRLYSLMRGLNIDYSIPFAADIMRGIRLVDDDGVNLLHARITKLQQEADQPVRLVVLDALVDVLLSKRIQRTNVENDSIAIATVCNNLHHIAEDTGTHFLIIHHANKNGLEERGSGALRAGVDCLFKVDRQHDDVSFEYVAMRDADDAKTLHFRSHFDAGAVWYEYQSDVKTEAAIRRTPGQNAVINALVGGGLPLKQIQANLAERYKPRYVKKCLFELVDSLDIKHERDNKAGEAVYELTHPPVKVLEVT